jgi:membrane protein EpsK
MDTPSSKFSANQHFTNLISNGTLVIINVLISLWYTPFLIRNLGSEMFGFIPLADSVTYFLGILTLSLNISLGRYLTIELEKGEITRANQVFNTTLFCTLLIISFTTPIAILLVFLLPQIFNVPIGHERNVQLLFLGTIVAFFLTSMQLNFSIATFARNRFDLKNIISLTARVGQVMTVLVLFTLKTPDVVFIGIGAFIAALLSIIGDYYLWKRLLPDLILGRRFFNKELIPELFKTGTWMLIYQLGFIIFLSVDMLVANKVLALSLAGMYGALLIIPKNLRVLSSAVGGIWGPVTLSRFSNADFNGMDIVTRFSIKTTGLICAIPIGLLSGLSSPFLTFWLGEDFNSMTWVLILMVLPMAANLITSPFYNIQLTMNRIKLPAVISVVLGSSYFVLAKYLAQIIGPIGIAAAGAITLSVNNLFFSPIYTAVIMKQKWWYYFSRLILTYVAPISIGIVSYYVNKIFPARSLFDLLLIGSSISIVYIGIIYVLVLSKKERDLIISIFRKSLLVKNKI